MLLSPIPNFLRAFLNSTVVRDPRPLESSLENTSYLLVAALSVLRTLSITDKFHLTEDLLVLEDWKVLPDKRELL